MDNIQEEKRDNQNMDKTVEGKMSRDFSKTAVIAFVWAIVFFFGPFALPGAVPGGFALLLLLNIIGLVLASFALFTTKVLRGKWMAVSALVLSILGILLYTLFTLFDKSGFV